MTRIVAVTNPKGGVGKSTVSANLSAVAAKRGLRPLLIDLDPQGSSSYLSGVDVEGDRSAGSMFQDEPVPPSMLTYSTKFGYDVVPAGSNLIQAEDWLHKATLGENRLRLLFRRDPELQSKYDFIVMDTAGYKGRLLTSALIACTDILIPAEASVLTLNEFPDFFQLISHISELREGVGDVRLKIDGVIFNKVRESTSAAAKNIQDVVDSIEYLNQVPGMIEKYHVAKTHIPVATAIEEAGFARSPVVVARPKANVSLRYGELFDELFSTQAKKENEACPC